MNIHGGLPQDLDVGRWLADALSLRAILEFSWPTDHYVAIFPEAYADLPIRYRLVVSQGEETTTEGFETADEAAASCVRIIPRELLIEELRSYDAWRLRDETAVMGTEAELKSFAAELRERRAHMTAPALPQELNPQEQACLQRILAIFSQGKGVSGVNQRGHRHSVQPDGPFPYFTGPMWASMGHWTSRPVVRDRPATHLDYAKRILGALGLPRTIRACEQAEQRLRERGQKNS